MNELKFPKNFLWGTATSAHQVEGNNTNNDWWQAEQEGLLPRSGAAADHYNRFAQDFAQAEQLGLNVYRFSIEWSRIEPEPGKFDEQATIHYRRQILYLREHGMEPVVTLHHFTNPKWFAELGGWENKKAVKYFERYAKYCQEHFGDYVKWWVTINEPTAYVHGGYQVGKWPPFKKSWFKALKVFLHLAEAHKRAYKVLKDTRYKIQDTKIGIAHNVTAYRPATPLWSPLMRGESETSPLLMRRGWGRSSPFIWRALKRGLEIIAVKVLKFFGNDYFLRLIKNHFDYIGVNYYFLQRISLTPLGPPSRGGKEDGPNPSRGGKDGAAFHSPGRENGASPLLMRRGWGRSWFSAIAPVNAPRSDMGWEIAPQGLLQVLREMHKYRKPILITENGLADSSDSKRFPFILNHLLMVYTALAEGIDIRGYLYWSLLDNFEWADGFEPRFGLIEVDYSTQNRKIRESAWKFANIVKRNAITIDTIRPVVEQNLNLYPQVVQRYLQKITKIKPGS